MRLRVLLVLLLLASPSLAATVPRCPQTPNLVCIDGTTPLTADWSLGSHKITGMTDPAALQDAATKNYVDQVAGGLETRAARLASAAALPTNTYANGVAGVGATLIATSFGALSVDGAAVAVGDRILVKNEAATSHNGIYAVTVTGGVATLYALTRTIDSDDSDDFAANVVLVTAGSANANTAWLCTVGTITVGTDAITYTQYQVGQGTTVGGDATGTVGNMTVAKINGNTVPANAAGALHNDGAGVLSWIANGAAGGGLPAGTTSHLLRFDGSNWVDSTVLQNNGTDVTDTGKLTVQGSTSKFGTASTAHTMDVGQGGSGGSNASTLRVRSGDSTTAAVPKIDLMRHLTAVSEWRTDGTSTYFDYAGTLFYESGVGGGGNPLTFDVNGNLGIINVNVPYTAASGLAGIITPAFNVGGSGTAGAFQVDQTGNVTSAAYIAGVNTNTAPVLSYVVPSGYVLEPPRGTQRLVGAITARSVGTARTRLRNEVRAFLTAVNTGATLLTKSYEMPPAFLFTYTGTQRLVGPITARMRGSARTRGRDDTKNIVSQAIDPGSITIGDGEYRVQPRRLRLTGNGRLTIKGKGFLRAIS